MQSALQPPPTADRPTELTDLFRTAAAKGASDILLTAGCPPCLRVNGEWLPVSAPPLDNEQVKQAVYGVLQRDQIARFERQQELDFSLGFQGQHRFRANVFFQRGCVGACFRRINNKIPTLAELGLPLLLEEFALAPQGLILVTGPTGHGKSTTQAALIDVINSRKRSHVVTVEDPIEYLHRNRKSIVEQREVGEDTQSFAEALRHVLRQAPDVVLIGEMRDLESISAALTAAETGHLVIATLHTNDCVQAIDRLLDVFPSHQQNQVRAQLSLCLLAVVAQRLLLRADGTGRVAAMEVLKNNAGIGHLIRDGKTHQIYSMMETHGREGMITMDHALKALFLSGSITYEEAKSRMRTPSLLDRG